MNLRGLGVVCAIGNFIETNPEEVWRFTLKWGQHHDEDLRAVSALTCEALLMDQIILFRYRERFRRMASSTNFGFEKVERLNGNVGYMELDGFVTTELGAETAIAAMQFLANTDALIIDLRYNGGGVPGTAQLIISYLFSETPVHYHSIYWRHDNRTEQFWTLPYVPGRRYVGKPVYILIGKRTLSAPESFAYSLQAQKRVTVVGEVSAGGANPGRVFRINEHFQIFVPTGRAINPVTKTNWEGTGVKPDIETSFANAL